jgi:hypothetical protein
MKTPTRASQDDHHTSIQFAQTLSGASEFPLVRLQTFRVPWAPLQTANRETEATDPLKALMQAALANEVSPQNLHVSSDDQVVAKLEVAQETTTPSLEIKISVREETPGRREGSEHRFWGINE